MFNKYILTLKFLLVIYFIANAQTAILSGKVDMSSSSILSVNAIIYNDKFNDTIKIDSNMHFCFKRVPYGIYNLKISPNQESTSDKELVIKQLEVRSKTKDVPMIKLSKVKTCDNAILVLGKKDTIEYYKTGEAFGKGNYKITKKYYPEFKSKKYAYRKNGEWDYFYKSGNILRKTTYRNDNILAFTEYYENGNINCLVTMIIANQNSGNIMMKTVKYYLRLIF